MLQAIHEARKGGKRVFPNPLVGALVLDEKGDIVSAGYHACCGAPHAERDALGRAAKTEGCTLVVTLEPCCHHGRTPPCTHAIIEAGIKRVVVAMVDPDPHVSGSGIAELTAHGIQVETGLMEPQAEELNETYIHHRKTGRSLLHLKMAGTLDGRSAAADGTSRWITGESSRQKVHEYRRNAHAVLAGGGTAIADDPLLTVRDVDCNPEDQPARIIYTDSELPEHLQIFCTPGRTIIATGSNISVPDSAELWTDIHSPKDLLGRTAEEGLGLILCEGGKTLAASLLRAEMVDRLSIFTAPALLGEKGYPLVGDLETGSIDDIIRLEDVTVERIGEDVLTEGKVVYRAD